MGNRTYGITVIDLFCGGGGFSEGFHQAGFDVVLGIDNWKPACDTHTLNGLGDTRNINLLEIDVDDVLAIKEDLQKKYGGIDIIIGSPPCTEFSYAKKGGKGDIEKGMILVKRNLLFVALFKPTFWLMENVPRLEHTLNKECEGSREKGWNISYERLGIPTKRFKELELDGSSLFIPKGAVFNASDFGTCQNRKRFIAGDFPLELMDSQKVKPSTDVSLGGLLGRLRDNIQTPDDDGLVEDPNYPHLKVRRSEIRDYEYDTSLHPMYWEEMRFLKRRHIQYGRMHLPENLAALARTIMATSNSSSRESLILETEGTITYHGKKRKVFRQPTVREVACIQGFPLNFQLATSRITDRYKLIGNAVPCQLAYALAKSISQDLEQRISKFDDRDLLKSFKVTLNRQRENGNMPIISKPKKVVDEAVDIDKGHKDFRAKDTKRIRRKLLSSTLEGHSGIVVFENTDLVDGKIAGGPLWKCCIQKGVGKKYYQIYLDEVSTTQIIGSLDTSFNVKELKALLRHLLQEVGVGIPILKDDWIEFPGWSKGFDFHLSFVTGKRLKLPGVTTFQKAFTSDLEDIGDVVGPIDFFDGLDVIMLSTFSKEKFKHLQDEMVYIGSLRDTNNYPHRLDSRIIPWLNNVRIPLVTVMASLIAVYVLKGMYDKDGDIIKGKYYSSLKIANDKMIEWCCRGEGLSQKG